MKRCLGSALFAAALCGPLRAEAGHPVQFDVQFLCIDANEGCALADVDGDGRLDVAAGRNWYRNPEWIPRPLREIPDWNGYVESNGEFAHDVNRDGRIDIVSGSFLPSQVYWYENPGEEGLRLGHLWKQHLLADTGFSQNEAAFLHDLDGDGAPEFMVNSWKKDNPLLAWRFRPEVDVKRGGDGVEAAVPPEPTLERITIGESGNGHGMAFGDINNDGREDILVGTGWYERPQGNPFVEPWGWHPDWDLHSSCPMQVRDLDGDRRSDLIWGKGHDYGLYVWWGLGPGEDGKLRFEEQLIDDSYSQPHALHFADLDGDGSDELITGKRVRAHNGKDPGGTEPPLICYYVWNAEAKAFTRHMIDKGRVGIGLQIRTADLDADDDLEIVVAGKEGTQILWNRRK